MVKRDDQSQQKSKVFLRRFKIHSASQPDVLEGQPGIVCAGVPALDAEDGASVLLLWDEGDDNKGCSLSNSIPYVLRHLQSQWTTGFSWDRCIAVERDSFGGFDLLQLHSAEAPKFEGWAPARWPDCEPRSWRAVECMLGQKVRAARVAIRDYVPTCGA